MSRRWQKCLAMRVCSSTRGTSSSWRTQSARCSTIGSGANRMGPPPARGRRNSPAVQWFMARSRHTGAPLNVTKPGVSVVVCCHDSAALLPATLSHLAAQDVDHNILWEVIIVDNGSTDGTDNVALRWWPANGQAPLRVISEPKIGLAYARARSVREAAFDIITFVDDDNWLCRHWVQTVYEVMRDHPHVGALGGIVEPQFETSRPGWFSPVAYLYATGPE